MTSVLTIQKEVEKLKEKTGTKTPRYVYVTFWHPPSVEYPKNTVKVEGEAITIRVECKT